MVTALNNLSCYRSLPFHPDSNDILYLQNSNNLSKMDSLSSGLQLKVFSKFLVILMMIGFVYEGW